MTKEHWERKLFYLLTPALMGDTCTSERLSPPEALRHLQAEACLAPEQAQQSLNEVYDERLAAEARRPA